MTGNKKWFSSLTPLSHKEYVTFGDDKKGKVLCTGVVKVNDYFTLDGHSCGLVEIQPLFCLSAFGC
jgi:hypothetical protein